MEVEDQFEGPLTPDITGTKVKSETTDKEAALQDALKEEESLESRDLTTIGGDNVMEAEDQFEEALKADITGPKEKSETTDREAAIQDTLKEEKSLETIDVAGMEEDVLDLTSKIPRICIDDSDKIIETYIKPIETSNAMAALQDKAKLVIIERLGVIGRLHCKFSECEIITTVADESDMNSSAEDLIIINFLKRLFLLDYRARQMHSVGLESDNAVNTNKVENLTKSFIVDFLQKSEVIDNMGPRISAADVMVCALHCSDRFLQQNICEKLALCQLAVPLIIPSLEGNESTYLLWGCQKIVKKWKTHKDQLVTKEDSVVTHGIFNVAVMRLGDNANYMSKSKVLNHMLGNCQGSMQHDYFLYRECDSPRNLSNGIVEACWFLPEGNSGEIIPDIACFLNLRGDGLVFKKQYEFLVQSAGLTIIFTDRCNMKSHMSDIMKITKSSKLVLVVDAGKAGTPGSDASSDSIVIIDGNSRSMTDISRKLCTMVRNSMQTSTNLYSLHDLAEFARNASILIDEDEESCLSGKRLADDMMQCLANIPLEQAKTRLVPLQGQHWIEWANHDKEKSRLENKGGNDSLETYLDKLETKMKKCRRAQVSSGISEGMLLLTKYLENEKIVKKYFLRFLQINLDNLSRSMLPPLYTEYNALKLEVRQLEQRIGTMEMIMQTSQEISNTEAEELSQSCQKFKDELEIKKQKISQLMNGFASKSFGLEHYLRELAQLYEAYAYACPTVTENHGVTLSLLPDFMADLILEGYPIELMDGSVSHIPIKWVTAVLKCLQSKLGDVRMFVLSVIGVESSGKSTMLNTMFGLRFAVSSGRCTRGVFAQMLTMDDSLKERLNCDCMLVLDTEGLRSPELSFSETYRHDNEIATFVICLANLTLINIGGQTLGNDMTDILQISAHAFIRMKEIEFNSKCMFVNQNVADSAAGNKKAQGMESLLKKLDEMTQAAAEEEGMRDKYWTFSQVFPLILNENIQFIPSLWQGGMSPPNPLYSEKLGKLRSAILNEVQDGISLSNFISRLSKLWEAVKEENFIFSFQNSLVIRGYSQLQHLYGKWTTALWKSVMDWELKAKQRLMMTSRDDLDAEMKTMQSDLQAIVSHEKDKVQEQLDEYFQSSHDNKANLIIRFKTEFEQDLVRISKQLFDNALATCNKVYSVHDKAPQTETLRKMHRDRMFKKAQAAASQLRGQEIVQISKDDALNDSELQSSFDGLYKQLLTQAEKDNPTTKMRESQIIQDVEKVIFDNLANVKRQNLKRAYQESGDNLLIEPQRHFQSSSRWYHPTRWLRSVGSDDNISTANEYLTEILIAVDKVLGNNQIEEIGYQPEYLEQLIRLILDMITDFKDPNKRFMFTVDFKVDVVLYVMSYAPHTLFGCQQIYERNHSLITCIEKDRESLFEEFIAFYMDTTHDALAASRLAGNFLEESVTVHMHDLLGNRLFDKMLERDIFRSKLDLTGTILADLACNENFDEYISYIRHYKTFVGEWILKYIAKACLDTVNTDKGSMTFVQDIADREIRNLVMVIKHAMSETTTFLLGEDNENSSPEEILPFNQWIQTYISNVQRQTLLYFHTSSLDTIGGYHIQNYAYFTQQAIENCLRLPEHVMEMLKLPNIGDSENNAQIFVKSLTQNVHLRLFTHVIGCGEMCPFCGVPCDLQTSSHDKHKSELHRPEGMNRWIWEGRNILVHEICTSSVASDCCYRLNDEEDWRPYKDYAKEFPTWFIQSIKDADATLYWKWVFKTFNKEFAKRYNAKPADLPPGWYSITKEQALDNLKATYNM